MSFERTNTYGSAEVLLLRPEAAAQRLSVSRTVIYKLLASGEIPSIKIGRLRRIPADALSEWIAEQSASVGGEFAGGLGPADGPLPTKRRNPRR